MSYFVTPNGKPTNLVFVGLIIATVYVTFWGL